MLGSVLVYLRVLVVAYWMLLFTEGQSSELYEGDICNQTNNKLWNCKLMRNCPKAVELLKEGGSPQMCGFQGSEPVVCCEPENNITGTAESKEGHTCKQTAAGPWTCKLFKDCPKAVEIMRNGHCPQSCNFTGPEPLVCCEPEVNATAGLKSKIMCEKYAEAVYIVVPDILEGVTKYDTCTIGKKNNTRRKRIVGGTESGSREFPHLALIAYSYNETRRWLCSGSLISERFILTAAMCAKSTDGYSPRIVRLGEFNTKSDSDEELQIAQPSEYRVIQVFVHPEFHRSRKYNDIALLKLNSTVFFTEFIRPICLHTQHEVGTKYALAAGWGRTEFAGEVSDKLLTVTLTIYSHDICFKAYNNTPIRNLKDGILDSSMLCAGDPEGGKDTCSGDGGTPLQVPLEEPYCMYSQVGITSFGKACGTAEPAVYTRVSHFIPWIESIVWPDEV